MLSSWFGSCFSGGDGDDLLWHMDLKPHATGDYSVAVVQANSLLEDQGQVFTTPGATYVGVYDGHGGPQASRFINNNLFPQLQKLALEEGGLSEDVIRKAFDAIEEGFLRLVKQSWLDKPQIASAGSCCLFGAISKDELYVANLGDSRAVLGRRAETGQTGDSAVVVAERLSIDHNVGVEEVRKEVEALHPDDSHVVVYTRGVWRIKGIIQVSRSIGDVYLKKPEFNRDPMFIQYGYPIPLKRAVMSAEPSILIRKIRPEDLFLIFASDGLWDQLSDDEAVDIVLKNPRSGIAKRLVRAALEGAAEKKEMRYEDIKRLEKGERRHVHDDITVIVIYLDRPGRSTNSGMNIVKGTNVPLDIYSLNSGHQLENTS
ncbi:probable protein phosphatase 2C 78 [Solanum stenotomum]|uniref:probable protein phosphatase 2C 78 n=1 Tax=Solanum stenotomum TaxID=172797 RepID=UPI0020D01815|nr:probable protein phosphatase 2C 78 [Solanum stenotomum]